MTLSVNQTDSVHSTANRMQTQSLRGSLDLRVTLGERQRGGVRHLSINSDHNTKTQLISNTATNIHMLKDTSTKYCKTLITSLCSNSTDDHTELTSMAGWLDPDKFLAPEVEPQYGHPSQY